MELVIVLGHILQLVEAVKHVEAVALQATLPYAVVVHIPVRAHVHPVPDHAPKSKH